MKQTIINILTMIFYIGISILSLYYLWKLLNYISVFIDCWNFNWKVVQCPWFKCVETICEKRK
jgi:hypothetical protein